MPRFHRWVRSPRPKLRRFVLNFSKQGNIPMRMKWFAEKRIEPMLEKLFGDVP